MSRYVAMYHVCFLFFLSVFFPEQYRGNTAPATMNRVRGVNQG